MDIEIIAPLLEDIPHRKKFGWRYAEDFPDFPQEAPNKEKYLARDKDMSNYELITALEKKYFETKGKQVTYQPANPFLIVIFLLLGLLPLILYLLFKSNEKNEYYNYNSKLKNEMESIAKEASLLL